MIPDVVGGLIQSGKDRREAAMEKKKPSDYAYNVLLPKAEGQEYPTWGFFSIHIFDYSRLLPREEDRIHYLKGVKRRVQLHIEDIELELQANPQHALDHQARELKLLRFEGWKVSRVLRYLKRLRMEIDEEINKLKPRQTDKSSIALEDKEAQAWRRKYEDAYRSLWEREQKRPTQEVVAAKMNMSKSSFNRKRNRYGFLWPPA